MSAAPRSEADQLAELEAAIERLVSDRRIPAWTRAWWNAYWQGLNSARAGGALLEDARYVVQQLEAAQARAEM